MFKFIHAADIHLDSPLRGLEQYEGAPIEEIRNAARRALSNLVDLAIEEEVAFVLIAGDLYDGDWRDYNTGLFFINQVRRLREANIPLYLISGNHDAANRMTRTLRMPENVTFFSADEPETSLIQDLDVAIHGQSFATAAVYEDLSIGYRMGDPGLLNIGMLHTCATGSEGHDPYAPCSVEGLKSKGYDYWALGHIHLREVLSEKPFIAFSGNIQGRHVRETGAKGCLLVSVHNDRSLETEFRALDVLRWERPDVDVSNCRGIDDVLRCVSAEVVQCQSRAHGRPLAMRIELSGETEANRVLHSNKHHLINEIRSVALDAGSGEVWIEKVRLKTTDPISKTATGHIPDDALSEIALIFDQIRADPTRLNTLGFQMEDVIKKLPPRLKDIARQSTAEWLEEVIAAAEPLLGSRLSGGEVPE